MRNKCSRPLPARRDFFTALGAGGAASWLLAEAAAHDIKPGAEVPDRLSTLRVTGLKASAAGAHIFIKLTTNHGITGWGETAGTEPKATIALAESLFELLDGENPTRIEYLWQKLYRAHRDIRGGPFMVHTISAIDMALWDIAGKLWNTPVYRLLGGPCRDRIRVYHTPQATKVPPHGIYEHSGSPVDVKTMLNAVAQGRKQVGPTGVVMFDAHCAVPPATLMQFAAALEPEELLFLEEPAVPGNIDVFKRLKQHIKIPLAAGERDRTIWEFIPYLTERALDVLQPDVSHSGGITQIKKIATLAEAFFVPLAPHCTNTFLGMAASFHAIAAVPLFLIHEAYPSITPKGLVHMPWALDKDGYVGLPPGPGLGVEVDEKVLETIAKDPTYKWKWPVYGRLKDGSISDY